VFERFNDHARRALVLAQEEARASHSSQIGDDHLLLGVLGATRGEVSNQLGISLEAARQRIGETGERSVTHHAGPLPFAPGTKKTLERSLRAAQRLGHQHIGPEHILLALAAQPDSTAAQTLVALGVDLNDVTSAVLADLDIVAPASVSGPAPDRPKESGAFAQGTIVGIRLSGWRHIWYRRVVRLPFVFYPLAWFNCSVPFTRGHLYRLMQPRELVEARRRRG
jgi:ATP-dependent Clp protease ATP-binding subunit ClpC